MFEPVMAPLLMYYFGQEATVRKAAKAVADTAPVTNGVDAVSAQLLHLATEFLSLDFNGNPGKSFEHQFARLLQLRAMALVVRTADTRL